ncbi:MAG: putative oxidoreductase EphD [Acidimicrobiales bacterium]|nr:putative oxidoreductase EphD [Acidimicrobiales bacterium]
MSARVWIPATRTVVTGAGSGIGRATAKALASRGAVVACVDINGEAARQTAEECGHGATAHLADVGDRDALAALDLGEVGIVVNNAGVAVSGPFSEMTADDWEWIRSVNLDGVVNGCAVWGPAMLDRGRGHVVNVSSGLGFTPNVTEATYCATKAAVLSLSMSLRADWAERGVGVTAICPGVIDTPIIGNSRFVGDQVQHKADAEQLFAKGHKPEAVAKAIVRAIEGDRGIALVGWESKVAYGIHRFAPLSVQQRVARRGLG